MTLLFSCSAAFKQERIAKRFRDLAVGLITCYGRHTVTGGLTSCGRQFVDWSATYRMFSQNRINITELYQVTIKSVVDINSMSDCIVCHMDDTLIRKRGKKIPGTSWKRDPLGPPFHTNFVWGQRFLQVSLSLAEGTKNCESRGIPVDFIHCPTPSKPSKNATLNEIEEYKKAQKEMKLTNQGQLAVFNLRQRLDLAGAHSKQLIMSVDGSYTTDIVFKNLPERTTIIGRIRKDAKLFDLPIDQNNVGRKKVYGNRIPTPEQLRQDEKIPWVKVNAWAAGKSHEFSVKIIKELKWPSAGKNHILQLIVIRPLGYRLTKGGKILYRQPAYLICTDNNLEIEKLLQAYLWRWEIEVNFRDQKTILGCGQAQLTNQNSAEKFPAFLTALYGMMHLAAYQSKLDRAICLPKAKWDPVPNEARLSTSEMINLIRCEQWCKYNNNSFSHFVQNQHQSQSHLNYQNPYQSAMFYSRK